MRRCNLTGLDYASKHRASTAVTLPNWCSRNPYCRIGNLVEAGIAQRQSASAYLKTLVAIGLLEEHKAGRERLFVNPALLAMLMRD